MLGEEGTKTEKNKFEGRGSGELDLSRRVLTQDVAFQIC